MNDDGTVQCPDHPLSVMKTKLHTKTDESELWYCPFKRHYFYVFPDGTILSNDGDVFVRG